MERWKIPQLVSEKPVRKETNTESMSDWFLWAEETLDHRLMGENPEATLESMKLLSFLPVCTKIDTSDLQTKSHKNTFLNVSANKKTSRKSDLILGTISCSDNTIIQVYIKDVRSFCVWKVKSMQKSLKPTFFDQQGATPLEVNGQKRPSVSVVLYLTKLSRWLYR